MPLSFYRRAAQPGDAFAILCLYRDALRAVDPPEYAAEVLEALAPAVVPTARLRWLIGRIRRASDETVVAFDARGILAGFGSVLPRRALLQGVYVAPCFQGRGVGRLLVDALESMAAAGGAATLKVQSPPSAQGFFAALGYRGTGSGRSVLGGGLNVPSVDMEKTMPQPSAPRRGVNAMFAISR